MKKKVLVYTSTRADYGLLSPLIDQLAKSNLLEPLIFVTGTHVESNYGLTIQEIKKKHNPFIAAEVSHKLGGKEPLETAVAMADALLVYSRKIAELQPDYAIVLGDRYEALSFGLACANLKIPLIHIHGGELTYGAIDDKFRHCLSKLAEFHFVACEVYRARLLQMGEDPQTVFNVGALGVENALKTPYLSVGDLEKIVGFSLSQETYMLVFHPETNSADFGLENLKALLKKLQERIENFGAKVIVTGVNSDAGSVRIKQELSQFIEKNKDHVFFFESLGSQNYMSAIRFVTAVVGNSSSGILEAHSLGTPALNVGFRQEGREREMSVIDLKIPQDIQNFDFSELVKIKIKLGQTTTPSLFGDGQVSVKMVQIIENDLLRKKTESFKKFYDISSR